MKFAYLVGVILPPLTLLIFVGGMIFRFRVWLKLPAPVITLFPAPEPGPNHFFSVLKATFFFPGLFKGDRFLWAGSWVFHAMLALILLGHIRVVTDFPALWAALGIDAETMSLAAGGGAGIIILATLFFLLLRRVLIPRVREIAQTADWVTLLLLLSVILTGDLLRFSGHFDLSLTREWFAGIFSFQFVSPPSALGQEFFVHYLLGQILIMYLPFSKLLHFGGIFFTQAALQRR